MVSSLFGNDMLNIFGNSNLKIISSWKYKQECGYIWKWTNKKKVKNFFDDKYYYRNSFYYHKKIYILEYDILYNMVDHYYYGNWKV